MILNADAWETELFNDYNDEHIITQADAEEDAWNDLEQDGKMWVSYYLQDGTLCGATLDCETYKDAKDLLLAEHGEDFGGIADYGLYSELEHD